MTIGERISNRRKELGLTQDELAEIMGYKSKVSISNVENNKEDLTTTRVKRFATALMTTPAYIMGWEDDPQMIYDSERLALEQRVKKNLSTEEMRIVLAYRDADSIDKAAVRRILGLEKRDSDTLQESKISRKDAG